MSCSRCGKVHDKKYICGNNKRVYGNKNSMADKFRKTRVWQNKRMEIVYRDKALCQLCIRDIYTLSSNRILNQNVQVHHIRPINEYYEGRLDNDNLISLCTYHHYMAEHGQIERKELLDIVKEQEMKVKN